MKVFGVYMFIHKNTAQKYVGYLLRRRRDYYFKGVLLYLKLKKLVNFDIFFKKKN